MAQRTTRATLEHDVTILQKQGLDIKLDWLMGRARATNHKESNLSWRLRSGEMAIWLDGFDKGASAEQQRNRTSIPGSDVQLARLIESMCNGPHGSETRRMPYGVPAIESALRYLAERYGIADYLDAAKDLLIRSGHKKCSDCALLVGHSSNCKFSKAT